MSQQARRLIAEYLLSEGGEADKTAVVEMLQDALDIQQNSAESYVSTYCETWTAPEGTQRVKLFSLDTVESTDPAATDAVDASTQSAESSGVSESESNVGAVIEVGDPTDDSYAALTKLKDADHPQVPGGSRTYYRRKVVGKKSDVQVVTHALEHGQNVILRGPTGAGKDDLIFHIAGKTNRPVYRVNFGKSVRIEDLIGHFELVTGPDGETITRWVDGALTRAVRAGGIFLADEINAASGRVTMALHAIAEKPSNRELPILQTGEVLDPHDQFRFVGTMNPGYAGTNKLNKAFATRFTHVEIDYLPPNKERKVIYLNTDLESGDREATMDALLNFAASLRESYRDNEITTPVSTRDLIRIATFIEDDFLSLSKAAELVILQRADSNDRQLIKGMIDRILFNI